MNKTRDGRSVSLLSRQSLILEIYYFGDLIIEQEENNKYLTA